MSQVFEQFFYRLFARRPIAYPYLVFWVGIAIGWTCCLLGVYYFNVFVPMEAPLFVRFIGFVFILLVVSTLLFRISLGRELYEISKLAACPQLDCWTDNLFDSFRRIMAYPGKFTKLALIFSQLVVMGAWGFSLCLLGLKPFHVLPWSILIGGQIGVLVFLLTSYSMMELAMGSIKNKFPPIISSEQVSNLPHYLSYKTRLVLGLSALVLITVTITVLSVYHSIFPAMAPFEPGVLGLFLHRLVAISLFSILLGIVFSFAVAQLVTQQYNSFLSLLQQTMNGNWSARTRIVAGGELAYLSGRLNLMLSQMESVRDELEASQEALLIAQRKRIEFLATLTHDIRSPIAAVMAFARFGGREAIKANQLRLTDTFVRIERNARRVAEMAMNLLDLEQIENKELQLHLEEVDLEEVLAEVMSSFSAMVEDSPIEFYSDLPPDIPMVVTDRGKLLRILDNLISNGLRVTRQGEVCVSVDLVDSQQVAVIVTDTGPGIPKEDLERIFEPRSRVAGLPPGGSGLGLTISRSFAKLMGGEISVQSEPGQGAQFTLILPIGNVECKEQMDEKKQVFGDRHPSERVESMLRTHTPLEIIRNQDLD